MTTGYHWIENWPYCLHHCTSDRDLRLVRDAVGASNAVGADSPPQNSLFVVGFHLAFRRLSRGPGVIVLRKHRPVGGRGNPRTHYNAARSTALDIEPLSSRTRERARSDSAKVPTGRQPLVVATIKVRTEAALDGSGLCQLKCWLVVRKRVRPRICCAGTTG